MLNPLHVFKLPYNRPFSNEMAKKEPLTSSMLLLPSPYATLDQQLLSAASWRALCLVKQREPNSEVSWKRVRD